KGIYALMDHVYERWGADYPSDPRILATGPAALYSDSGGICSVPIKKGELSYVDTWAGRGGLGTKMLREHGIAAVIYGGSYVDEDFRNRTVADEWFQERYKMRMAAKDMEATTKYRFDPKFGTGGTFGVNYTTLKGRMLSFNYRSVFMSEEERLTMHKDFVVDHYLKQFNEETIETKQQKTCGEPCSAVCKKLNGEFKKDYEPYQTMGPLSGIFDQRAAELLNHHADTLGYDAISIGGVIAWLMECLHEGILTPADCGVSDVPRFSPKDFRVVEDSLHNAKLGIELLDNMTSENPVLDLSEGARKLGRRLSREKGTRVLDSFVYIAFGRKGWMVPNQYWTAGPLSPMAIMGKYYMHYGADFIPPRLLGNFNAERLKHELILDNLGICRFHRGWAEELAPKLVQELFGLKDEFLQSIAATATRINSRNASVFWESERDLDFIHEFLKRHRDVEGNESEELAGWLKRFEENKREAALDFWYEIHKGIQETLQEFQ
ncbi:aldehyde ferredoxin oxidoreductase, partial [Myxococcota bacterium]|nr:aldehyde ferredoxin oxidoreductase [Myxococcota bacterium]